MWNIDLIQEQQYYEKQVTVRGGHTQEGRKKTKKMNIVDILSIQE
jgi:hypothetical protein